jgi:hypothetical protein
VRVIVVAICVFIGTFGGLRHRARVASGNG